MSRRDPGPPSRGSRWSAAVGLLAIVALGCSGAISVRQIGSEPRSSTRQATEEAVTSAVDELCTATRQVLRQHDMEELWIAYPELVVRALDRVYRDTPEPAILAAVAELTLHEAERLDLVNSFAARGFYLVAAARAYDYLFAFDSGIRRAFDPVFDDMTEVHRRATGGYLHGLLAEPGGLRDEFYEVLGETYQVRIQRRGDVWDPGFFGEMHLAEQLDVRGFRSHYRVPGFGVPLVGVRENPRQGLLESYYPPAGMIFPLSAVLRFDADEPLRRDENALFDDFVSTQGQRSAVLAFYNPLDDSTIEIAGSEVPLAFDITAPLALQAVRDKTMGQAQALGFRDAEEVADLQGLYMHEPYDPEKIPVLMIHGLRASPLVWLEMTNELEGDPEIRPAYQIWHYFYPSGLPYLYNGAILRRQLQELDRLDPNGTHLALRSMVIVAHSMGGLLAKTLVSSSGTAIWDGILTVGPEQVQGLPEDVERLQDMLIFEPLPSIERVIFLSTPHRGSRLANAFVGRLGSSVIRLPEDYTDFFHRLSEANWDVIRPEVRKTMARGGPTSIKALSPQDATLQALAELPFAPGVKLHTIIGDRDAATGDPEVDSDGVVTHESAHLPEALSELFVPGRHNVYSHALAILEVKRILKEHLRERRAMDGSS